MNEKLSRSMAGMVVMALFSAPCVGGLTLIPIGLGSVLMASGLFLFLDTYRLFFMAAVILMLGVTHWEYWRSRARQPARLVWAMTALALLLVAAELLVDPLWARHALVPM